jgi:hypothetical protein
MYKMSVVTVNQYVAKQQKNHRSFSKEIQTLKEGDWVLDFDPKMKRYGNVAMKVLKINSRKIYLQFVEVTLKTDFNDETKANQSNLGVKRFKLYPPIPHQCPSGSYIIANNETNNMDAWMFTHWSEHTVFADLKTLGEYVEYVIKKGRHSMFTYGDFFLDKRQAECEETLRCLVRTQIPLEIKYLITDWL